MLRRSHRKSRGGCLECKRRHVKCDENRPKCRLCTASDRQCHFPRPKEDVNATPGTVSPTHGCWNISNGLSATNSSHDVATAEPINLTHMELIVHALLSSDMFNLAVGFEEFHRAGLTLGFETVIQVPYLMYQVLAFSACHLAHVHPKKASKFHHQAVMLQTRALSMFNASSKEIGQSNCVQVLLFSAMLGQHLLADTLAKRQDGGLDGFIMHYVQCVEMHRGVYTIATSAWPLLMQSDLEPILSLSQRFTSREPRGDECVRAHMLLQGAQHLGEEEKQACASAIRYLQVGLDAVRANDCAPISRYQMVCEWTMLVSPQFTALLSAKQPIALVVLCHYAALLHHARHLWQVGDVAVYIFDFVMQYLGTEWEYWLQYPRSVIVNEVPIED